MEGGKDFLKNSNYFISKWAPENRMRKTSLRALWHFEDHLISSLSSSPAKIHQNIHKYKRAFSRPRKTTQFAISRRWIPRPILFFLLISPHMSNMWGYIRKSVCLFTVVQRRLFMLFLLASAIILSLHSFYLYEKEQEKRVSTFLRDGWTVLISYHQNNIHVRFYNSTVFSVSFASEISCGNQTKKKGFFPSQFSLFPPLRVCGII